MDAERELTPEEVAYVERVRRARAMSPSERVAEGFRLFEEECERLMQGLRLDFPNEPEQQLRAHLRAHWNRVRQREEEGIYTVIDHVDETE